MKLATTTSDFSYYAKTYEEAVSYVLEAGFRYLDLSLYDVDLLEKNFSDDQWEARADALLRHTQEAGGCFVQAHSPNTNPLLKDENYDRHLAATKRSFEVCARLGIPNTVFHTGWAEGISKEEYFHKNANYIRKLIPVLEETGVNLLIENSTRGNMGEKYFFYTGADMVEFLQYLNHPLVHACWDVGHAHMEGHNYSDIRMLGKELFGVHICDNHGKSDEHIMPYFGTINMDEILCALRDIRYPGIFTFEADNGLLQPDDWPYSRTEFSKETRLLKPSLHLRKQAEKLLFEIGKEMLTAYDCYEE